MVDSFKATKSSFQSTWLELKYFCINEISLLRTTHLRPQNSSLIMHLINLTLAHYRGVIVLTGPSLADAQAQSASNISKPPHALHITLLTAVEYKSLGRPSLSSISESLSIKNIYAVGAAHSPDGRVSWMVVIWNHGDIWRRAHGLGRKEYHITLSEGDQHSLHKGVRSLLKDISVEELVERMKGLGEEAMDHTIVACGTESAGLDNALVRFDLFRAEIIILTFLIGSATRRKDDHHLPSILQRLCPLG